jgi:hypothetical protein
MAIAGQATQRLITGKNAGLLAPDRGTRGRGVWGTNREFRWKTGHSVWDNILTNAFVALAFALTPALGGLVFAEPISVRLVIGIGLILCGLLFVAG